MDGLVFIVPALLVAYWALSRFTRLGALQRGVALAVLAVFTEVVAATLWWPGSKVLIRELVWGLLIAYLVGMLGYIRESRRDGRGTGLHGWGLAFVTLMFAFILVLNLGLVYVAEQGLPDEIRDRFMPEEASELAFPGLVAAQARPQEELLRRYLRGLRRIGERGWNLHESWSSAPSVGVPTELTITITQQNGNPVNGAEINVGVLNSFNGDRDRWLELKAGEGGNYVTPVEFSSAGIWGLLLRIDYGGETLHLFSTTKVSSYPRKDTG